MAQNGNLKLIAIDGVMVSETVSTSDTMSDHDSGVKRGPVKIEYDAESLYLYVSQIAEQVELESPGGTASKVLSSWAADLSEKLK